MEQRDKGKEAATAGQGGISVTQVADAVVIRHDDVSIMVVASAIEQVREFDMKQIEEKDGKLGKAVGGDPTKEAGYEPAYLTVVQTKTGNTSLPGQHFEAVHKCYLKAKAWMV